MKKVCVIGSLNMDLVASVDRFPQPGETISGKRFGTYPGGKGANQAVALGRLGAEVRMIGKVGDDIYGDIYRKILVENGVHCQGVQVEKGISSGIAVIEVDGKGENHIIIIPGANGKVDKAFIDQQSKLILDADIFLFQLEIPLETVIYTMERIQGREKVIILDPAPARHLPDDIFPYIDFITPNEREMEMLTGKAIVDMDQLREAASVLLDKGVRNVIAKVGKKGAYWINKDICRHVPGFVVEAVDTTAAGDSFNAGFACGLSREMETLECITLANAAGALSTTAIGAQEAMPSWNQIQQFIKENNDKNSVT